MKKPVIIAALAAAVAGSAAAWQVQQVEEERAELLARAAVSAEAARAAALAAFPGAAIVESEIEEENGRLIYSFELQVAGQDGEVDVEVDAMTGELLPAKVDDDDGGGDDDDDDPAPRR
jgi:uncharacterized membrane protein YkoI